MTQEEYISHTENEIIKVANYYSEKYYNKELDKLEKTLRNECLLIAESKVLRSD